VVAYVDVAVVKALNDRTFVMDEVQISSLKYYIKPSSTISNCNVVSANST
jgi:hypothetical protein